MNAHVWSFVLAPLHSLSMCYMLLVLFCASAVSHEVVEQAHGRHYEIFTSSFNREVVGPVSRKLDGAAKSKVGGCVNEDPTGVVPDDMYIVSGSINAYLNKMLLN
jgi:hypothetical protein